MNKFMVLLSVVIPLNVLAAGGVVLEPASLLKAAGAGTICIDNDGKAYSPGAEIYKNGIHLRCAESFRFSGNELTVKSLGWVVTQK